MARQTSEQLVLLKPRGGKRRGAGRRPMPRLVIEAITLEPIDLPRRTTPVRVPWRSGVIDQRRVGRRLGGNATQHRRCEFAT